MKSVKAVKSMYSIKRPTSKNVIRLINAIPINRAEEKVLGYLKLFIKSPDEGSETLARFLTGANIICVDHIDVTFNKTPPGAGRIPVAHTCGHCLDLSTTYAAYCQLKSVFSHILVGDCRRIDIV